jgi:alkanesulfonate monooxygenase SsuD/methylene tetrahydromethanopterin reductase-like flavin-dependent oxidoreductase (luciferase family)
LSAGRLILGVSPGGLASDFELFGLTDQKVRREMAAEAIELVLKLWTSEAPFDLRGKYWRISLTDHVYPEIGVGKMIRPYQLPHPPLVASAMSPNSLSSIAAGRRGWGLISANFIPAVNVATHWQGYVEGCRQAGRLPRPQDWRVARSIFVAEDDREAKAYVRNPEGPFAHYYGYLVTLVRRAGFDAVMRPVDETGDVVTPAYACDNLVIAGDPATVAAEILALREQIGDFGTLVATATDLQSPAHKERLHRSFELLAREVLPRVNAALERPQ